MRIEALVVAATWLRPPAGGCISSVVLPGDVPSIQGAQGRARALGAHSTLTYGASLLVLSQTFTPDAGKY